MKSWISLFSALALFPSCAIAQSAPAALRLVSEDPEAGDGERCGINKSGVEAAVRSAMRYNRVVESENSSVIVYTSVTPLFLTTGLCAVSYDLQIKQFQAAKLSGVAKSVMAATVYCQKGGLVTGRDMGARMPAALKVAFDDCLNEIATSLMSF